MDSPPKCGYAADGSVNPLASPTAPIFFQEMYMFAVDKSQPEVTSFYAASIARVDNLLEELLPSAESAPQPLHPSCRTLAWCDRLADHHHVAAAAEAGNAFRRVAAHNLEARRRADVR